MNRFAFLLSARWLRVAALTVLVSIVCSLLGVWQFGRHIERSEAIERVQNNSTAVPVPVTELLPTAQSSVGDALEWRSITVTGEYLPTPVALPQRGTEQGPADHALAVFAADVPGGTWLIVVDRGSYPTDAFNDQSAHLDLPAGQVQVTLRLRPAEPASDRVPILGQVFTVNPQQVLDAADPDGAAAGQLMTGGYGWLTSETPTTPTPPTPLLIPAPDYRSNLSYALQWWTFAVMAYIGFGVMVRRELRVLDGKPAQAPRRRLSDADIEDAALDAAEAAAQPQASETSSA